MEIKKAQWATDGDKVRLSMPLSKVDTENRLVSGFASLDNADSQGDVVLAEASKRAFARFRGNIREMHQPIAVGKMVDFKEDSYYDPETQKFYNGIYVTVYVSKGAESTWEKVLDGTLQGFSIGGAIVDSETQWVKDADKVIRFVKDYELVELSLVDSPANQLANVFSITKSADGMVMKGMIAETQARNVFWCNTDNVYKTSTDESAVCPEGHTMENVGWFEYEGGDDTQKLRDFISNLNSSTVAKQAEIPATNEGGVNVAEENEKTVEETETVAGTGAPVETDAVGQGAAESEVEHSVEATEEAPAEVTETEAPAEAPTETEKAANVSEVEADEPDFAKMFGDLQSAIEGGLVKNSEEAQAAIAKATETFESKINELVAKHDELTEKFASLKTNVESVEKRVGGVEDGTAVKKSGDLGGSTEDNTSIKKGSIWSGRFLGVSDLQ